MLYIQGMSSCAVQEIVGICNFKNGKEIMVAFCKQTLGNKGDCRPNGGYSTYSYGAAKIAGNKGSYTDGLGENYVFHGVEKGNYYTSNGYASKFAAWITENKLGQVYGGDPVKNHRYHPDHLTRVFVWNPDREAVKAWWAENGGPPIKPATPKAPVVLEEAKFEQALAEVEAIIADALEDPRVALPKKAVKEK